MPLQATSGAATYDAFGGGVPVVPNYIEEVFSTWLYTGNGSTQTITNGIDLAGKGGLVWIKSRNAAFRHYLFDTARGMSRDLSTNNTDAQGSGGLASATSTGFSFSGNTNGNQSSTNFASWTFRKQPKFFDVVTYTGNGGTLSVSHALASKPGCIIIKRTDNTGDWLVCTRKSDGNIYALYLNQTAAQFYDGTEGALWTSTSVSINWINSNVSSGYNTNGASYVMYLFAHNAGGFGLTGSENVISCGSYTGNGSGSGSNTINLGYEPQFLILKAANGGTSGSQDWNMIDNMRGWTTSSNAQLNPNLSAAETDQNNVALTSNGFSLITAGADFNANGNNYIYIAIRRGPMRTPTNGTSVFSPIAFNAVANTYQTTGFPIDWQITADRNNAADKRNYSRLTGIATPGTTAGRYLSTNTTDTEAATGSLTVGWDNTGFRVPSSYASTPFVAWNFGRAPGFFDQVCYTGTGSATTFSHNLGVVPEMMIVKSRSGAYNWAVYCAYLGGANPANRYVLLNSPNSLGGTAVYWNDTAPTSSVFTVGTTNATNASGSTYIAYLFASVPGVSKVGSYTGTGATLTIDCGFTGGARFVLIKRTDSSGTWWVWDTSRGMVAGTDPRLLLNDTTAETNNNWVYTVSTGFQIVTTDATVNASGGSYIFLAIA